MSYNRRADSTGRCAWIPGLNVSTVELTNGVIGLHDPNSNGSVVRFNTAFAATTSLIINAGSADYNDLGNISL